MPVWIGTLAQGLIGLLVNLTDPKQYDIAKLKRLEAACEAAEKYIFVDEKSGDYEALPEDKQTKYKAHFRKRFFHYK